MFLANSLSIMLLAILEPIYRLTQSVLQVYRQQVTGRTIGFMSDISAGRIRPPPLLE